MSNTKLKSASASPSYKEYVNTHQTLLKEMTQNGTQKKQKEQRAGGNNTKGDIKNTKNIRRQFLATLVSTSVIVTAIMFYINKWQPYRDEYLYKTLKNLENSDMYYIYINDKTKYTEFIAKETVNAVKEYIKDTKDMFVDYIEKINKAYLDELYTHKKRNFLRRWFDKIYENTMYYLIPQKPIPTTYWEAFINSVNSVLNKTYVIILRTASYFLTPEQFTTFINKLESILGMFGDIQNKMKQNFTSTMQILYSNENISKDVIRKHMNKLAKTETLLSKIQWYTKSQTSRLYKFLTTTDISKKNIRMIFA